MIRVRILKSRKISCLLEASLFLLLALVAITINQKMIRDGVIFESYDIRYHINWLQHFSKQFSEGILYPRWLAGDNYGYGSPTFVFYPPLVYYLGSLLKISGLNAEQTIITLFSLAIFTAGFSFYIFGCSRWGKVASVTGAVFYMSTPYLAYNIYLRGALTETWSLFWIPLGLWVTDKAIVHLKWRLVLAIVFALVALTHVPNLLLFTIFWLLYAIFLLLIKPWKSVVATVGAAFTGFGLASFYLLPAILEKSLVNIEFMRFEDGYKRNLISFGFTETTNNILKHVQPIFIYDFLVVCLLTTLVVLFCRNNRKTIIKIRYWLVFLFVLAFLMLYPSVLIWQASSTLQMVQFPWRLLGLLSFGAAALCAIVVDEIFKRKLRMKMILLLIIISVLLGNMLYSYKLSLSLPGFHNPGEITSARIKGSWKASVYEQVKTELYDPYTNKLRGTKEYRPLLDKGTAAPAPVIGQPPVSLVNGKAEINLEHWRSYNRMFKVRVQEASIIRLRTYYYPAWHLSVNNKPYPIKVSSDGTINIEFEPGFYKVKLYYQQTPVFTLGIVLSILSLSFLGFFALKALKLRDVTA